MNFFGFRGRDSREELGKRGGGVAGGTLFAARKPLPSPEELGLAGPHVRGEGARPKKVVCPMPEDRCGEKVRLGSICFLGGLTPFTRLWAGLNGEGKDGNGLAPVAR